jgi:hypothetical protein
LAYLLRKIVELSCPLTFSLTTSPLQTCFCMYDCVYYQYACQ